MISINTNLGSLIVQNNLKTATKGLNQAIERMTTGFKINGAKDNAANYSIATDMSTKIGAYQIAEENTSMGLDMLMTANESLDLISNGLSRIRALQEQASNGTYGEQSLKAINSEVNAIIDEIERTYKTTEFNGINLFGEISSGFIQEITRRDTSTMTSLASVDETQPLAVDTYSISTAEELAKLATMTNNGLVSAGTEFVLANNIDLSAYSSGEGWVPVGAFNESNSSDYSKAFKGSFDGNGYVISNLKIDRHASAQGLFGNVSDATIKNIQLQDIFVTANRRAGGLLGWGRASEIVNCVVEGSVSGAGNRGLLCGLAINLTIDKCATKGVITDGPYNTDVNNAGGLCGYIEGSSMTISNSYSDVDIISNGSTLGGLVARVEAGTINNCYAEGTIETEKACGGFVGLLKNANITNCYTNVELKSNASHVAGFAMNVNNSNLNNCGVLSYSPNVNAVFGGSINVQVTLENCYYNELYDKNNIPYYKTNYGTFTETGTMITNAAKPYEYELKYLEQEEKVHGLQVGISSEDSSRISLITQLDINGLSELRKIGLRTDKDYLSKIDEYLSKVNTRQTEYGATQNRLESALEEISIHYDNLVSSRSTIMDADIAEESSSYIKMQILQQASATLLATANQTPSIALQLL